MIRETTPKLKFTRLEDINITNNNEKGDVGLAPQ